MITCSSFPAQRVLLHFTEKKVQKTSHSLLVALMKGVQKLIRVGQMVTSLSEHRVKVSSWMPSWTEMILQICVASCVCVCEPPTYRFHCRRGEGDPQLSPCLSSLVFTNCEGSRLTRAVRSATTAPESPLRTTTVPLGKNIFLDWLIDS